MCADIKLPASVKHISAFVNLGRHWNRVRLDLSTRQVLIHESVPKEIHESVPKDDDKPTPEQLACVGWFLNKYSLPTVDHWEVVIHTDVQQHDGHSCGPITAMLMWRDVDSNCPLGRKNNDDGPPLKEYRKLLLDQLRRNMGSLGIRPTGDAEQDDKDENQGPSDDETILREPRAQITNHKT